MCVLSVCCLCLFDVRVYVVVVCCVCLGSLYLFCLFVVVVVLCLFVFVYVLFNNMFVLLCFIICGSCLVVHYMFYMLYLFSLFVFLLFRGEFVDRMKVSSKFGLPVAFSVMGWHIAPHVRHRGLGRAWRAFMFRGSYPQTGRLRLLLRNVGCRRVRHAGWVHHLRPERSRVPVAVDQTFVTKRVLVARPDGFDRPDPQAFQRLRRELPVHGAVKIDEHDLVLLALGIGKAAGPHRQRSER